MHTSRNSNSKVTSHNLRALCWLNGINITQLAARVQKSRWTIYRAVDQPRKFPDAYREIESALPRRK